jgi:hypothetical protein
MEEQGRGFITVNVRTAGGALPVEGATVTVSRADNSDVVAVMITDSAGTSEVLGLPTPPKENSFQPGNKNVSSFYIVDTYREGYYEAVINDVPIFDGVTSIQQVLLVPIAIGDYPLQPKDLTRINISQMPDL